MVFTLIAHRGLSSSFPENTLVAFDSALERGWASFETDVQLSSDLVPLIVHDEELKRVASPGQAKTVCHHTAAELTAIDVGSWFDPQFCNQRIPTLDAVLRRYHGRAHLHLELKTAQPQLPDTVAKAVEATGWLQYASTSRDETFAVPGLTLTSFHLKQLRALRLLLPSVRLGWLVHDISEEVMAEAAAAGIHQLCPRANIVSRAEVDKALQCGFSVRGWGIKNTELLLRMKAAGAQGCTVDWPGRAEAALGQADAM